MYDESVILEKLARFKTKFGWMPVPHSIPEVERMNRHIESLAIQRPDGIYFDTDNWTPKLKRYVLNERAYSALDASYFLTRYFFITDSETMRFSFRSGQRAFYSVIQGLERSGKSIEIQCLKARKQGISTLVEGLMTHAALLIPGSKCSVASADDQKTLVMMGMMYGALQNLPWWLPPKQTKDKRASKPVLEFSHVNSSVVVQSGSMKGGIGQGTTPRRVHLSECADYTNPVAQIEEGLFKAVPSEPDVFLVLESTGNGNTGWWADQWRTNKKGYEEGRARLLPLFLPWFMTPEMFPTEHWMKKFGFPESWKPSAEAEAMRDKSELYVRDTSILKKILGENWKMPDEQIWYWEYHYQDAKERGTEKSWQRQMPCDDLDALVGENDAAFDRGVLANINTRRKENPWVYGILGNDIQEKNDPAPAEVTNEERVHVEWKTPSGVGLDWYLMPLRGDTEDAEFDPLKRLIIYEHPQKGARYSIGGDLGRGVMNDNSCINVTRVGFGEFPDYQAAEFACNDISEVEIIPYFAAIAAYYGSRMGEANQPKIAIENRRKYGDITQNQLKLMGFRKMHDWHMFDKATAKPRPRPSGRQGIFMGAVSRPIITGLFKHAIENGWYVVNSRWLLAEIEGLEMKSMKSGRIRMDHSSRGHDDRYFAACDAYFTSHSHDILAERAQKKFNAEPEKPLEIDYRPWYPTAQGVSMESWLSL